MARVVVVTGAAGAVGGAVAERFARAGDTLVLVDHRASETLSARAKQLSAMSEVVDLTDAPAAFALVERVRARCGRLDGLVHTVGGFSMGKAAELSIDEYERLFSRNVRTLVVAVRAVLPSLLAQRSGFLVGFSAAPGVAMRGPGMALYAAAKAAVTAFLRSVDGELDGTDVRALLVVPMGAIDTPKNRADMGDALTRPIDPAALADAIVFAASSSAAARLSQIEIHPARQGTP